jgi:hypothetical protein
MSLGAVRPDDWNLPLLLHVLGAMVLVALVASVVVLLVVWRRAPDRVATLRFAFRTLLLGAIPAYILMRATAEWLASKEDIPDDPSWLVIGYSVADDGLVLLIIATILAGLAARRARLAGQGRRLVAPATALMLLLIAAYAVALWAMVTKPA